MNRVISGCRGLRSLDYHWCWSTYEYLQMHSFPSQSFFTGRANLDVRCTFCFKNVYSAEFCWKSLKWRVPKCAFLINRYLTIVNIMYAHRLLNSVDLNNHGILFSLTLLSKMRSSDWYLNNQLTIFEGYMGDPLPISVSYWNSFLRGHTFLLPIILVVCIEIFYDFWYLTWYPAATI